VAACQHKRGQSAQPAWSSRFSSACQRFRGHRRGAFTGTRPEGDALGAWAGVDHGHEHVMSIIGAAGRPSCWLGGYRYLSLSATK
jgi:hypothetical protein